MAFLARRIRDRRWCTLCIVNLWSDYRHKALEKGQGLDKRTYRWAPTVSLAARWQMYARVIPRPPLSFGRQHVQEQSSSIGSKSSAYRECLRFRTPRDVMAFPKRCWDVSTDSQGNRWSRLGNPVGEPLTAVLVGQTQSNMSAPRATATTMSSG